MGRPQTERKQTKSDPDSSKGTSSSAGNAEELETRAAYEAYKKLRDAPDKAFSNRDYQQARQLYLKGAKSRTVSRAGQNWCSQMYAGAAASAYYCTEFSSAIQDTRKAFENLDATDEHFLMTFEYIVQLVQWLSYYTNKGQRKRLSNLQNDMYSRFRTTLLQTTVPPQTRHPSSYKLHGELVQDDFSYLEDMHAQKTTDWLAAQQRYSQAILQLALAKFEAPPEYRASGRWQKNSLPVKWGQYFYFRTADGSGHRKLTRSKSIRGKKQNVLSSKEHCPKDYFITDERISWSGKYALVGMSKNGSDWQEWRLRDIARNKELSHFKLTIYSGNISLHRSGKGVLYAKQKPPKKDRLQEFDKDVRIYYKPYSKNGKERLIYKPNDKNVQSAFVVDLEESIMLVHETRAGERHGRYKLNIQTGKRKKTVSLFGNRAINASLLGYLDRKLFFLSYERARMGKIIAVTLDENDRTSVEQVISERPDYLIRQAFFVQDRILVEYQNDLSTSSLLNFFNHSGAEIGLIDLPFDGLVSGVRIGYYDANVFFSISNFANCSTIYRYNFRSRKTTLFDAPSGSPYENLTIKLVKVRSKDGATVPMWLVHAKHIKPNSQTPTLMSVYGGFNLPQLPTCHYEMISWCEMGGLWAQPYLRGGGELGTHWHEQARKTSKQKTFDDAIACAQYLINSRRTSAKKLAIKGESNGGLTVAAVVNQAPHLFGAAITSNGLFDMLKFHTHTVGWSWQSEYGNVRKKSEYMAMRAYSPYHNLTKPTSYPAFMLCVDSADDRVPPWHSFKYIAALQALNLPKPVILRIEQNTGHSNTRSNWQVRDQQAFLKLALDF